MDNLSSSINAYVSHDSIFARPVRIAILDSGFDLKNPSFKDPRIRAARSFAHGTEADHVQDEIGHGTHALGLLRSAAPCADIYVARVAQGETLDPNTYDDIAKVRTCLHAELSEPS
jgi:subtilisin family serine protease